MSLSVRPSEWLWQSSHGSVAPSLETILCLHYAQLYRISQPAMTDYITFHIWLHKHSTGFVSENLSAHEYKGTVVSCADNKRYQHSHSRPFPDSTVTSTKSFQKINNLSKRARNVRLQMSRIEKYFILNRSGRSRFRGGQRCVTGGWWVTQVFDSSRLLSTSHQLSPPLYKWI